MDRRVIWGVLVLVVLVPAVVKGVASARFKRFLHDPMAQVVARANGNQVTEGELVQSLQELYGNNMLRTLMVAKEIERKAAEQHVTVDPARYQIEHARLVKNTADRGVLAWQERMLNTDLLLDGLVLKTVPEADRRQFYDQFKDDLATMDVYHILVGSASQARQLAEELKAGGDFAAVAGSFSLDTRSKLDGGHLGPLTMAQIKRAFGNEAAARIRGLTPGRVSDPIHTRFGYHIFKVTSVETTYDQLKPVIDGQLAAGHRTQYMKTMRDSLGTPAMSADSSGSPAVSSPVFEAPKGHASSEVFSPPSDKPCDHAAPVFVPVEHGSSHPEVFAPVEHGSASPGVFDPVERGSASPGVFAPVEHGSASPGVFAPPEKP
ncbi:MAG TPA: peptidylprolyl isomerase [Candidatus Xenobia bacterium]